MRRCSQMSERVPHLLPFPKFIHSYPSVSPSCRALSPMPWSPVPTAMSSASVRTLHSSPHPVITPLPSCGCQALGQSPGILECRSQNVRTQGIPEKCRQRWLMSTLSCNCPDYWNYLIRATALLFLSTGTRLSIEGKATRSDVCHSLLH